VGEAFTGETVSLLAIGFGLTTFGATAAGLAAGAVVFFSWPWAANFSLRFWASRAKWPSGVQLLKWIGKRSGRNFLYIDIFLFSLLIIHY